MDEHHADLLRIEHLLGLGRHKEAEELARAVLAQRPGDVSAMLMLAAALLMLDRNEESLEVARAALASDPDSVECQLAVGDALVQLGRAAEAVPITEAAIAHDPHDWTAHFAHARALSALPMPRVREALESIDRAIRINPHHPDLHTMAGLLLTVLGLHDKARQAFEAALRINPQHTVALTSMADLNASVFRLSRSAGSMRSALASDAQHAVVHEGVATLAWRMARRLLFALVVAAILVGLEVYAGAAFGIRALTGVLALGACGLLVHASLVQLPRGMARSPGALWRGIGTASRVALVACGAIAVCLCVMAFAPLGVGAGTGILFVRTVQALLVVGIVVGVALAVGVLVARRR